MAGKEAVKAICDARGLKEPLEFLASLMEGHDPRELSKIYTMAESIEEDNFGDPPDSEQWEELLNLIRTQYKHAPVAVGISKAAATELAQYQHSKRKSVEISNVGAQVELGPLTEEELELFEAWFNGQF